MQTTAARHILVVDDDAKVRLLLRRCLEQDGYRVSEAVGEADTMKMVSAGSVDLVTLDLNLNGEDGLDIARSIRAASTVPIVMVTGKGDTIDRVVGLELGADDYISKPFHVRELLARIRTVLRRTAGLSNVPGCAPDERADDRYTFGTWTVDFSKLELHAVGGEPHELTTAEFKLLEALIKNAKRVLTRDQLMDHVNGRDWSPFDRSIDNQIARLRRKIENNPAHPELIKTVRGVGYSFTADVELATR